MKKSEMAKKYVQLVQDMYDLYEGSKTVVRCAVGTKKKFQGQGRTAPGISVKFVPVCNDYG